MPDAIVWTVAAGAVATAILSIIALCRFILGAHTDRIRFHDAVMGDGNGRKPIRDLLEQVQATVYQHTLSDERQFAKLDRHLEIQDATALTTASALALATSTAASALALATSTAAAIKERLHDK